MGLFDGIQDMLSGAGEQFGNPLEDISDQVTEITDQAQDLRDGILPGEEENQ